ncbi:MAG: MBL fold metallo-hydrolase [Anaerolineae bacterium]|nr:MBL fold metallo-hydrolase [Anaerolineae bacterium]
MQHDILDQLICPTDGIVLCWLGNLSWLIHCNNHLIAFDLDLDHDLRLRPPSIPTEAIAPCLDMLFITHEHGDHFNARTAAILVKESDCRFVIPASCRAKAHDIGVPPTRLQIARPRQPFDLLGIRVEPLRALHGDRHQAVYRHANLDDCGYILTLNGRRLLQPGDSVLLQDHLELTDIDVLFVSPTDHNMAVEPAATLIRTLSPSYIFPQHFGTYRQTAENSYWTHGFPDELKAGLPSQIRKRYHKLEQGEVFYIPPDGSTQCPKT